MRTKLYLIFFLMITTLNAMAQEKGIGLMLGNPTGLNGKYWLNEEHAVDGGLAFSLGKHNDLSIHSDYLLHNMGAFFFNDVHPLDLYYGLGGRMEFGDDIQLGVRVPVGLAHKFTDKSADVFAEAAPIFDLFSGFGIELHVAVGARYYF